MDQRTVVALPRSNVASFKFALLPRSGRFDLRMNTSNDVLRSVIFARVCFQICLNLDGSEAGWP
jgi:hypothetical protein